MAACEEGRAAREITSHIGGDLVQQVVESSTNAHRQSESHPVPVFSLRLRSSAGVGSKASASEVTSPSFAVTLDWSVQTMTLAPDPEQWLRLGARHVLNGVYGWGDIDSVLRDVDIDIIILLHPLQIVPMRPKSGGLTFGRQKSTTR